MSDFHYSFRFSRRYCRFFFFFLVPFFLLFFFSFLPMKLVHRLFRRDIEMSAPLPIFALLFARHAMLAVMRFYFLRRECGPRTPRRHAGECRERARKLFLL